MARRKSRAQLTPGQLAKAKAAYESGATFDEIAGRHGVSESHVRRRLHRCRRYLEGPRQAPGGTARRADRRGLARRSDRPCHRLKHELPHHVHVVALLRRLGADVQSRPGGRRKIPGVVLGSVVTNRQAVLRRRPPMIPTRTDAERWHPGWTPAEAAAIDYEIRAGRYRVVPRGVTGLRPKRFGFLPFPGALVPQRPAPAVEAKPSRPERRPLAKAA